jgi:hypothetical protein
MSTVLDINVKEVVQQAHEAAVKACNRAEFDAKIAGHGVYCGFAWVDIISYNSKKIRGNSNLAKELMATGFVNKSAVSGGLKMWNPAKSATQNMLSLEAGAIAAEAVFREAGFTAFAGSRAD